MPITEELENFYLSKNEPQKSCLLALRTIILNQDEVISETVKYGMPCFCYRKKMFCYIWTDMKTNEPYILFVEGNYLKHPMLESGTRARMKIFRIDAKENIPVGTVKELLDSALNLYRSGTIQIK